VWLANLESGEGVSSKLVHWTSLSKEKKIVGLQLFHPHFQTLYLSLKYMDFFYYTKEAIASIQDLANPTVIAEIIGGHDLTLNAGVEIRLDFKGTVKVYIYPLSKFKYDPSILIPGFKPSNANSVVEA